jgi:hypothetical protein
MGVMEMYSKGDVLSRIQPDVGISAQYSLEVCAVASKPSLDMTMLTHLLGKPCCIPVQWLAWYM